MKFFSFTLGGPDGLAAELRNPGDFRTTDDMLALVVDLENKTDVPARAVSLEVRLRLLDDGKRRDLTTTTVAVDVVVPPRGTAVAHASVPLSMDAALEQVPTDAPQWFTQAIGVVSDLAQHASDTANVEVTVSVFFDGQEKPCRSSQVVTRHGHGSFGFRV